MSNLEDVAEVETILELREDFYVFLERFESEFEDVRRIQNAIAAITDPQMLRDAFNRQEKHQVWMTSSAEKLLESACALRVVAERYEITTLGLDQLARTVAFRPHRYPQRCPTDEVIAQARDDCERVKAAAVHLPPRSSSNRTAASDRPRGETPPIQGVVLRGLGVCPLVAGKEKPPLTLAQFDVVKALLDAKGAGRQRLTGPELDDKSGHPEARKYLRRLALDLDWRRLILFPRVKGDGYGIA